MSQSTHPLPLQNVRALGFVPAQKPSSGYGIYPVLLKQGDELIFARIEDRATVIITSKDRVRLGSAVRGGRVFLFRKKSISVPPHAVALFLPRRIVNRIPRPLFGEAEFYDLLGNTEQASVLSALDISLLLNDLLPPHPQGNMEEDELEIVLACCLASLWYMGKDASPFHPVLRDLGEKKRDSSFLLADAMAKRCKEPPTDFL